MAQLVIIRDIPTCETNYSNHANQDNITGAHPGNAMYRQSEESRQGWMRNENKPSNIGSGVMLTNYLNEKLLTTNGHVNVDNYKMTSPPIFPPEERIDKSNERNQVILLLPYNPTPILADREGNVHCQVNWMERSSGSFSENGDNSSSSTINTRPLVGSVSHVHSDDAINNTNNNINNSNGANIDNQLLWMDGRNKNNYASVHPFDCPNIELISANGDLSYSIQPNTATTIENHPLNSVLVQLLSNASKPLSKLFPIKKKLSLKKKYIYKYMYIDTHNQSVSATSDEWIHYLNVLPPLPFLLPSPSQTTVVDQEQKKSGELKQEPTVVLDSNENSPLITLKQVSRKGRPSTAYVGPPSAVSTGHRVIKRRCDISEKKFVCKVCGKKYKYETNLITHSKVHTEQALECHYCHKKFGRKTNYVEHLRIHTNERPYKCRYCDKSFKQNHGKSDRDLNILSHFHKLFGVDEYNNIGGTRKNNNKQKNAPIPMKGHTYARIFTKLIHNSGLLFIRLLCYFFFLLSFLPEGCLTASKKKLVLLCIFLFYFIFVIFSNISFSLRFLFCFICLLILFAGILSIFVTFVEQLLYFVSCFHLNYLFDIDIKFCSCRTSTRNNALPQNELSLLFFTTSHTSINF
ncbi:hypothetical protein RFI_27862 [Reticulomyxa filosa]|uniref:C2H2-type domain-containing protein n=1 Tax=Reticulomyxa filosa TaxID=46433 RepID=X6M7T8_RETFI|nr:hypothetical protein RFI_27862 [Reticulomyxa filosa]|eukprot:ETO09517.1 hypothetical protein RFI_27862 [Reticulomyxa filosa]